VTVCPENGEGDRKRPAVIDDTRSVGQRCDIGEAGVVEG
jgi:hypothetical protein